MGSRTSSGRTVSLGMFGIRKRLWYASSGTPRTILSSGIVGIGHGLESLRGDGSANVYFTLGHTGASRSLGDILCSSESVSTGMFRLSRRHGRVPLLNCQLSPQNPA